MKVLRVCTGRAQEVTIAARKVLTVIGKRPREGGLTVHTLGLEGDGDCLRVAVIEPGPREVNLRGLFRSRTRA